jgi:predicted nucleotidyltransferase
MEKNLEKIKKEMIPILKSSDVSESFIFGSYARGANNENSDIDMLVDFKGSKTLLDLVSLKLNLEKKIGKKVDLVTPGAVSPLLRDIIEKERVKIL